MGWWNGSATHTGFLRAPANGHQARWKGLEGLSAPMAHAKLTEAKAGICQMAAQYMLVPDGNTACTLRGPESTLYYTTL